MLATMNITSYVVTARQSIYAGHTSLSLATWLGRPGTRAHTLHIQCTPGTHAFVQRARMLKYWKVTNYFIVTALPVLRRANDALVSTFGVVCPEYRGQPGAKGG